MSAAQPDGGVSVPEEDALRAHMYRLLTHFLANPPSADDLKSIAGLGGDDTELGRAIRTFSKLAAKTTQAQAAQEYQDLFIGVGRGELVPYASYYLTGFLHEKPLAKLREDMGRLGIERRETVKEPEDHIGALFEMMAGLITGSFGQAATVAQQRAFFDAHISTWAPHFFRDLEGAQSSVLYAALGTVGRVFLDIEIMAFTMD